MCEARRILIACVLAAGIHPLTARAQVVEFSPYVGMHTPLGLLMEGRDVSDNSFVRRRQLGGLLIGANLGLRPKHTFGLEATATYSPTMVAITDRDATQDIGGHVLLASLRAVARISGQFSSGHWGFYAAPGVGVVRRGGVAWTGTSGTTDRAVVIAGGARLGRLNSSRAFRFDVTDYITRASFQHSTERSDPRIHHDVVWSFGIAFPITR